VKLHDQFAGFLKESVNINATRLEQLEGHEKALASCLRGDAAFGPMVEGLSRQGSWAHRTIIKPQRGCEYDADLLVEVKRERSWSKDPARYLSALYDALADQPRYRGKVTLKTRCVRVTYAGDCHVDLVPYLHVPLYGIYDQQFIVNRKTNEFERVNPQGFVDWVRGKDRLAHGHLRTTLRLLKYLRDHERRFDIPSVILTVVVGGRANGIFAFFERYADLPTGFRSLVASTDRWLQDRPEVPRIRDPSCPAADFSHRITTASYRTFREQFHVTADGVRAAYKEADREESIRLWRGVFGDAFSNPAAARR
jgi:hypothetical protein